jgi:23S rRNA pseudoU1915 N3-methylase RlmH
MSDTNNEVRRSDVCDTAPDAWIGRQAKDIPPGWMDHMIRRLFDEWNREMIKLEDLKSGSNKSADAASRAHDARTLAQLERSLERLIKLETARAALRSTKVSNNNEGARAALVRDLDKLLGPGNAPQVPGDPE